MKFEFFFPLTSGSSENNNCYDEVKIWMEIYSHYIREDKDKERITKCRNLKI